MAYSTTVFFGNQFVATPIFENPLEALKWAAEKSAGGPVHVGCCARSWVAFDGGKVTRQWFWRDMYLGDPDEQYNALQIALYEFLK